MSKNSEYPYGLYSYWQFRIQSVYPLGPSIMAQTPHYSSTNKQDKMRTFFLFSLLVAAASAFVAPANRAVGKINII